MEDIFNLFDITTLYPFLLLLARVLSFMAFLPVLGHMSIPIRVKVALSFYFAIFLFPHIDQSITISEQQLPIALIGEITLGFTTATIVHIVFAAVKIAGELISYSAALSMAQMFDPASGTQSTLVTRFFDIIIIVFFFATGMHEILLMGIAKSFEFVHIGMFALYDYNGGEMIMKELTIMMLFAFSIVLPILFISMIMDMFFGYATRSMPQFSVFVVTFQLKFILIFFALTYITTILVEQFKEYFLSKMFM